MVLSFAFDIWSLWLWLVAYTASNGEPISRRTRSERRLMIFSYISAFWFMFGLICIYLSSIVICFVYYCFWSCSFWGLCLYFRLLAYSYSLSIPCLLFPFAIPLLFSPTHITIIDLHSTSCRCRSGCRSTCWCSFLDLWSLHVCQIVLFLLNMNWTWTLIFDSDFGSLSILSSRWLDYFIAWSILAFVSCSFLCTINDACIP